ncbi:MAG: pyridoxamine 5'-phosphate oxidase family protein [Candidatus Coatesbacteria bacterium]|nr:pyridoxamine 5'-phosphate oxidase family protein [Candidatus Coatesbacteria bacterium]
MNFDELKALMERARWGYLATTDGERPGVRPMGGCGWFGKEFWCATGMKDDKTQDIKKRPHIEYCFCDDKGMHVRLSGKCEISTDKDDKRKLLDFMPMLKDYVGDADNPDYIVLRLKPEKIRLMDMNSMKYEDVSID